MALLDYGTGWIDVDGIPWDCIMLQHNLSRR
jgi:hypothetical protein